MKIATSLRSRLMVLILMPLTVIACLLGFWRYSAAIATAEELFDRALLAAILAVSRDVAVSGGDALSVTTRDLVAEAAGGQVFYHVAGPDRAYVIGYGYPPVPPADLTGEVDRPVFYEAVYRGDRVKALRLLERTQTGLLRGVSTVTVWQRRADRQAFANVLARQSAAVLGGLMLSVAIVIWFSVNRGLRPLRDLEQAIAARTSDDLGGIRRAVPVEVQGIVATLNDLFGQVRSALKARDAFISDAAHQLRNPVAGMLALAEAAETASTDPVRRRRIAELRAAAERTARLTTQMLALERARGQSAAGRFDRLDLDALVQTVAARNADRVLGAGVEFDYLDPQAPVTVSGDPVLLEEAVENLIDNALRHGPPGLTRITVSLARSGGKAVLRVSNDGTDLRPEDATTVLERFGQLRPSDGSGLGLSIVAEIAARHSAHLHIDRVASGASVSVAFPLAA